MALRAKCLRHATEGSNEMASIEAKQTGQHTRRRTRIGSALAPVSRALYRTGLWLVYGGAAAEMIFHGVVDDGWTGGRVSVGSNAAARS